MHFSVLGGRIKEAADFFANGNKHFRRQMVTLINYARYLT